MQQLADHKRSEQQFSVKDLVYLKLQPYRQHSLKKLRNQKLSQKYFRLYPIEAKVGEVAYKPKLPTEARIHSTFHVSQLKKHIGSASCVPDLPPMGSNGSTMKEPI